jgi:nucleoside-diphosphate-sugar epimerase
MKFTVLGAGGFIGSRLQRYLYNQGHEVYAPKRGADEIFRQNLGNVIYAIGLTADFREKPYETAEAHVCYLNQVLQRTNFSSLLYLSSTRVYQGAASGTEKSALAVFPDTDGLYNLTKLTGEALCLQTERGRVARLSNIVGEGASESFVSQLLSEAATGKIHLRSALTSSKDYLLIDDAIKALATLASHNETGIFNVGSGKNTTTKKILDAMSSRLQFTVTVDETCTDSTFPIIDTSRIRNILHWQPQPILSWIKNLNDFER